MELFRLFGTVLIEDKDAIEALKNVDKKGEETGNKVNKSFDKIKGAAKVAGAAIATGFTAFLASGVSGAMEAEEASAQLEAVLKSTGGAAGMTKDGLIGLSDEMERTTKFTSESTQAAESLLLTFTNIGSTVFPEATKTAADMATALGTDMSSQAITLGKALNDPTKGISALTRVGVTFTDEQKNQIKAMQEAGDTAGAQKVILNELNKEFGGSAEAAGNTLSGSLEILKNAMGAVSESAITGLMPHLKSFTDWAAANMPTIQSTVAGVFDGIGKAIGFITDNSNILIPVLAGLLTSFLALKGISAVTVIMDLLRNSTILQTIATQGLNAAMKANPLGLIVTAIGLAVAAGTAIVMNWDTIKAAAEALWSKITEVFGAIKDTIGQVFDAIATKATEIFDGIKSAISEKINAIKDGANDVFGKMKDGISTAFDGIKTKTSETWNNVKSVIGTVMGATKATVSENLSKMKTAFEENGGGIKGTVAAAWEGIKGYFTSGFSIIDNLAGGKLSSIKDAFVDKLGAARDFVKGAIDKIKGFFDFKWELPELKMPHFKVSGSINPIDWIDEGVPKFSVDWYKSGGIFSKPTIFNTPYGLKGVGDATSPEVVAPLKELKSMLGLDNNSDKSINLSVSLNIENFNNNTDADPEELAEQIAFLTKRKLEGGGQFVLG